MSNVLVEKNKLDVLATAISNKSGEPLKLTLDEMVEAVDGIDTGGGEPNLQAKTYTVDSAGTETVTADSGYDGLSEVEVSVPEADPYVYHGTQYVTQNNLKKWQVRGICDIDDEGEDHSGYIGLGTYYGSWQTYSAVPANTSVTPTTSAQTIGGRNYMMEGAVTVAAMPTGTAGTPTATKGTVSNNSITVTPSVTNTTGYITGSTITGTAITITASELVQDGDNEAYGHGEIWVINATPTFGSYSLLWDVDFITNSTVYSSIYVMGRYSQISYESSTASADAYSGGTWTNQAYRTIEITGGVDKDNAEFRAWLEANAVRQ